MIGTDHDIDVNQTERYEREETFNTYKVRRNCFKISEGSEGSPISDVVSHCSNSCCSIESKDVCIVG